MSKFKVRLLLLFTSLLILTNLDGISRWLDGALVTHSLMKSFVLVVLMLEILVPYFRRLSLPAAILIWTGIYLVLRFLVFSHPVPTLIELLFWVSLAVLAHLLAHSLDSLDDAIQVAVEGGQSAPAIGLVEAQNLVRAEVTRSRHYNRPFSLIAVQCPDVLVDKALERVVAEIRSYLVQKHLKTSLARTLREELRAMDIVMDDRGNGNLLLLCPEVDAQNAEIMMDHLSQVLERDYGFNPVMASASFPDASPTFDGLLDLINQRMHGTPTVARLHRELAKSGSRYSD